ncbi:hypothetical protein BDD12DRAFT_807839 [Trichophaea hybrida]|nr:hypothetical protein BDD12DRAFT_807839 [Trichophaea hybrida]
MSVAYTHFTDDPNTCQIIGDTDIYGLGIRPGFYLQYVAILIAFYVDPKATRNARTGLNIFSIAVLITEYRTANWAGSLIMLEFFIVANMVLLMTLGLFLPTQHFYATRELLFFFAPVNAYGRGWEIFFKIGACSSVTIAVVILAVGFYYLSKDFLHPPSKKSADKDLKILFRIIQTCLMVPTGALSIGMAELTMKRNNIDLSMASITSTGQLIPTLFGALSVVNVSVKLGSNLTKGSEKKKRCECRCHGSDGLREPSQDEGKEVGVTVTEETVIQITIKNWPLKRFKPVQKHRPNSSSDHSVV